MNMIKTNGIYLHYRDTGNTALPALILINPLGADCRSWDAFIELIKDQFRCISYDKRGHGLSESTPSPYRIQDHANDLVGLLQALNIRRAILCGISVGGIIALAVAGAQPELTLALILCNSAVLLGTPQLWNDRIHQTQQQGLPNMVDQLMARWFCEDYRRNHPAMMVAWRAMVIGTSVQGYIGTCAALRDADLTSIAKNINTPTLCLSGTADVGTPPAIAQQTAQLISDARFTSIDGAGHFLHIEQPDSLANNINAFLQEKHLV